VWSGLPPPDIVIGAEVFLCMTEPVLGAGIIESEDVDRNLIGSLMKQMNSLACGM